jgi:hypothetical protein
MIEPQRHRDTEKTQSHPPIPICPQITQMTQILFGSGLPKPARSMSSCHPLVLYRRGAETQRIHEYLARGEVLAAERRPRTAGPGYRSDRKRSSRLPGPAACAQRAQASPLLLSIQWEGGARIPPDLREVRRNRRAPSLHFSPAFVARSTRCRAQRRLRPEGRGVVLDSTSSTPRRENSAGCGASPAAAESW